MVDHRADEEQGLNFLVNARENDRWQRPGILQQLRDWLAERFDSPARSKATASWQRDTTLSEWITSNRSALALSTVWAGALIAYGVGYFARLGSIEGGASMLPTLDLVFFVFAILGPIAMIWFAVAMLNRATHLSDAITGQSESALALAATISNLNDSVDALSAGTTGRLEQACDRMEREASASVKTLEKSLSDVAQRLETALLDGVILMDQNLKDRMGRVADALETQQSQTTKDLHASITAIQSAMKRESSEVSTLQRDLVARTDAGIAQTTRRLDAALKDLTAQQKAGLGAANDVIETTANKLMGDLSTTIKTQIVQIDQTLKATHTDLIAAATDASQTIRTDLGGALGALRKDVDDVRGSVAASPPATAEDLAAMMGEAAHRIVSPERSALTQSVLRISALEEQARSLLDQIDRTSRLMPLLDSAPAQTDAPDADQTTPLFGALPTNPVRTGLNWTAVVHALKGAKPVPGTREIIEKTLLDPDLSALIQIRDDLLNALGERGLFAEDLEPEHCASDVWHAWLREDEALDATQLAGIRNEVSNAIARGWLRQDTANMATSVRYLQTYDRLLRRAVADACEDRHLVELADTSAGRLFMLLGGLTGLFNALARQEPTNH